MRVRSPLSEWSDRNYSFFIVFCQITTEVIDPPADLFAADSHMVLPFWRSVVVTPAVGVRQTGLIVQPQARRKVGWDFNLEEAFRPGSKLNPDMDARKM